MRVRQYTLWGAPVLVKGETEAVVPSPPLINSHSPAQQVLPIAYASSVVDQPKSTSG